MIRSRKIQESRTAPGKPCCRRRGIKERRAVGEHHPGEGIGDAGKPTTDWPRPTMHDLRHTAASLAISAGANVKAVQTMLGHKSAALTLDTYAELFRTTLRMLRTLWTLRCWRCVNLLRTHCGRIRRRVPV